MPALDPEWSHGAATGHLQTEPGTQSTADTAGDNGADNKLVTAHTGTILELCKPELHRILRFFGIRE